MKIPPYFLNTVCHSVLHGSMERVKRMDVNLITWRIGKALGMVE